MKYLRDFTYDEIDDIRDALDGGELTRDEEQRARQALDAAKLAKMQIAHYVADLERELHGDNGLDSIADNIIGRLAEMSEPDLLDEARRSHSGHPMHEEG